MAPAESEEAWPRSQRMAGGSCTSLRKVVELVVRTYTYGCPPICRDGRLELASSFTFVPRHASARDGSV